MLKSFPDQLTRYVWHAGEPSVHDNPFFYSHLKVTVKEHEKECLYLCLIDFQQKEYAYFSEISSWLLQLDFGLQLFCHELESNCHV